MGTPQGGVWKTTSAGVTWYPIFDDVTEADGIGAVQVAPSDPNIVYVGTGDSVGGPSGTGMYKSSDAGKTWKHIGLEETLKINKLVVDPKDPNLVLASATGDASGRGSGVYRSTDGGQTWQNVLKPEGGGGTRDLEYAFDMPTVDLRRDAGDGGRRGGAGAAGGGAGAAAATRPRQRQPDSSSRLTKARPGRRSSRCRPIPAASAWPSRCTRTASASTSSATPSRTGPASIDPTMAGATWKHVGNGESRVSNGQGNYGSGVWVDSRESRHRVRRQRAALSLDRRRQHVHGVQGRSGRRRLSLHVDRSDERPAHAARRRSGRERDARRRKDVEQLVQPAGRADLPRVDRHALSVLGDGGGAGYRRGDDTQPRRLRADQRLRRVAAPLIRVRHDHGRPAPPRDHLRRRVRRGARREHPHQDRHGDRAVGERRAEFRRRLDEVPCVARFLEALRHGVRADGDVRRVSVPARDA